MNVLAILAVVALVAAILLASAIRVLREYERGVVFRLGRLIGDKGPRLVLLIPIIDPLVRVDLRTVTLNIPPRDIITRDNVSARVTAIAYFNVVYPRDAIVQIERFLEATSQIAHDAALGPGQGRARHVALLARGAQRGFAADHRRADRAVGREGQHRRDGTSKSPRRCSAQWLARPRPSASAARRSSTPKTSSRRPSVSTTPRRYERQSDGASAALPPDPRRARLERSLDHRVPHADRPPPPGSWMPPAQMA